jgi:hypothetical protein
MKMKKRITFLCVFITLVFSVFGIEKKVIETRADPVIKEVVEKEPHKIICTNGMLSLKAEVKMEDERVYPFVFIFDTGAASSSILMENSSDFQECCVYQIGNTNYLLCNACFEDFEIDNYFLTRINQGIYDLSALKKIFSDKNYYFAVLGNDILMHKSLYLSITKEYFIWGKENTYKEQMDVLVPQLDKVRSMRGNKNCYQYSIYIEDDYFKSDESDAPILGFFNSPDKTKSRYFIDTGTYYMATSNIDLYYQVKNRGLKSLVYKSELSQKIGYTTITNPVFIGKKFSHLNVVSGRTPEMFKCLGNQALAAFDIYFDKEGSDIVQKIYFQKINDSEYQKYRAENDKTYYYPAASFGFRASNALNRVTEKAYFNGRELLKDIEIGDTIISINDVPYNQIKEWELPDSIVIEVQKKNGKIKKVKAKRYLLNEQ